MNRFVICIFVYMLACCQPARREQSDKVSAENPVLSELVSAPATEFSNNPEIVCLVYHRFGDARYPSTNVSIEEFDAHLKYLVDKGFRVVPLGVAVDIITARTEQAGPVAVITVDDGYRSFKTGALPILKKYGFKATLFVNTESIGGGDYLNWSELGSLQADSIEIGNHSHSHLQSLSLPKAEFMERFRTDVHQAQELFRQHLGLRPDLFAYPYGEYLPEMFPILAELGFRAAAAQKSGVFGSTREMYAIPRFPMAGSFARMESFREKVNMRALHVTEVRPASLLIEGNDLPELMFRIEHSRIKISSLQAFVGGIRVIPEIRDSVNLWVALNPARRVSSRRTPYTITAQHAEGGWVWYTHMLVHPAIPE